MYILYVLDFNEVRTVTDDPGISGFKKCHHTCRTGERERRRLIFYYSDRVTYTRGYSSVRTSV